LNSNVDQNLINSLNDLRNKKIRLEGKLEIALIKKQLNTLQIENARIPLIENRLNTLQIENARIPLIEEKNTLIENQLNTLQNENSGKKYKIKLFG
jgi:hypothetical protein